MPARSRCPHLKRGALVRGSRTAAVLACATLSPRAWTVTPGTTPACCARSAARDHLHHVAVKGVLQPAARRATAAWLPSFRPWVQVLYYRSKRQGTSGNSVLLTGQGRGHARTVIAKQPSWCGWSSEPGRHPPPCGPHRPVNIRHNSRRSKAIPRPRGLRRRSQSP